MKIWYFQLIIFILYYFLKYSISIGPLKNILLQLKPFYFEIQISYQFRTKIEMDIDMQTPAKVDHGHIKIIDVDYSDEEVQSTPMLFLADDIESTPASKVASASIDEENWLSTPQYDIMMKNSGIKEEAGVGSINEFGLQNSVDSFEQEGGDQIEGHSLEADDTNSLERNNNGAGFRQLATVKIPEEGDQNVQSLPREAQNAHFTNGSFAAGGKAGELAKGLTFAQVGSQDKGGFDLADSHGSNDIAGQRRSQQAPHASSTAYMQADDPDKSMSGDKLNSQMTNPLHSSLDQTSQNQRQNGLISNSLIQGLTPINGKYKSRTDKLFEQADADVSDSYDYSNLDNELQISQEMSMRMGTDEESLDDSGNPKTRQTSLNQKRDQLRKLSNKYKPQNRYNGKDGRAGIKTQMTLFAITKDPKKRLALQGLDGSIAENAMEQYDEVEEEYYHEQENDVDVDEIDDIMEHVGLNHSISKIGRSPMGRLGNPMNFQNDEVISNYLSLVGGGPESSPTNKKLRRHSRISFKKRILGRNEDVTAVQQEYEQDLEVKGSLSVAALEDHMKRNHPHNMDEETGEHFHWSICENLSSVTSCGCCTKRKIPKAAKNIGLGASLFLLSLKAYLRLFLVLSIMSVPACVLLASGNEVSQSTTDTGLARLFAKTTLGNIGYREAFSCSSYNIAAMTDKLELRCPRGTLDKIISVGLNAVKDQEVCIQSQIKDSDVVVTQDNQVFKAGSAELKALTPEQLKNAQQIGNYVAFEQACSSYLNPAVQTSDFAAYLVQEFGANCQGREYCAIDGLDYSKLNVPCQDHVLKRAFASKETALARGFDHTRPYTGKFDAANAVAQRNPALPEPMLYLVAHCDDSAFAIRDTEISLTKSQLSIALVVSDILLMTALMIGLNVIAYMQKDYIEEYDKTTVEVRDFTLVINKLPESFKQYKDELSLKFALWAQIQNRIQECKDQKLCSEEIDPTIVEINLGETDIELIEKQRQMGQLISQIEENHIKMQKLEEQAGGNRFKKNEELSKAKIAALEKVKKLQDQVEVMKLRFQHELGLQDEVQVDDEEKDIDEIQVKWRATSFVNGVKNVYVTFASMQTKNLVAKLFFEPSLQKLLRISEYADICGQKEKQLKLAAKRPAGERKAGEKEEQDINQLTGSLYVVEHPQEDQIYFVEDFRAKPDGEIKCHDVRNEPDMIIWRNMNTSLYHVIGRRVVSLLVLGFIFGLTVLLLDWFTNGYLKAEFPDEDQSLSAGFSCGKSVTMLEAYESTLQPAKAQTGEEMACFCRQQFYHILTRDHNLKAYSAIDFNAFRKSLATSAAKPGASSGSQAPTATSGASSQPLPAYCQIWLHQQLYVAAAAYGPALIVVLINTALALPLSIFASKFERHASKDKESLSRFLLIATAWFCNTALILIFYQQKQLKHTVFDSSWYATVCATLGFTLFQMFVPQILKEIIQYLGHLALRLYDRGGQLSLYKETNPAKWDETNSDEAKSRKTTQESLNRLYTGPQFDAGLVQAQVLTVVVICIFYSSTMPLLYPVCLMYIVFMYWYCKFMLLKYCQRSQQFNEHLVVDSFKILKVAVFIHMIMGLSMFKNSAMLVSQTGATVNFDNTPAEPISMPGNLKQLEGQLRGQPAHLNLYIGFIIASGVLYGVNLLLVNPVTCWLSLGLSLKKAEGPKQKAKQLKAQRIQKYLEATGQAAEDEESRSESRRPSGDIEMAENLDASRDRAAPSEVSRKSGASNLSRFSAQNAPSRQSVLEHRVDLKKLKNAVTGTDSRQLKGSKAHSTNYISELSFDSLRFHYSNVIDAIMASNRRMNLYFRIAGINKGTTVSTIFGEKYKAYNAYHDSLLHNKLRIEKEINYYWTYVKEHIDVDHQVQKEQLIPRSSDVSLRRKASIADRTRYFENDRFQLRVSKIPGMEVGEAPKRESEDDQTAKDDYKSVQKRINEFQRANTLQFKAQEEQEEYQLRYSCRLFFHMLDYLDMNFDEEWLRNNYLPRKLRCQSITQSYNIYDSKDYYDAYANSWLHKAEMILENPFMNPTINSATSKTASATKAEPVAAPADASALDQSAVGISQRALVAADAEDEGDDAGDQAARIPDVEVAAAGDDEADKDSLARAEAADEEELPEVAENQR